MGGRCGGTDEKESTLIEQLKAGDDQAFEALFRRYGSRVYRQAINLVRNPADAEEVVQEVFLTVYEKAKTFRGDSTFSTWLYRVTANVALGRLRKRKGGEEISIDEYLPRFRDDGHHLGPIADWSQEADKLLLTNDLRQIVRQAIDQLPPVDRAVVVMSDIEGIANREISEALGLTVPAVKARLHRTRLFLRGMLATRLGYSAASAPLRRGSPPRPPSPALGGRAFPSSFPRPAASKT